MKQLSNILNEIKTLKVHGSLDCAVNDVAIDSRSVRQNTLFLALKGSVSDGHDFIDSAINNGAVAIVCEVLPEELNDGVTYIMVSSVQSICGQIASAFFDYPSHKLKIIGTTGTNGKTTVSSLLHQMFSSLGFKCGLISTIKNMIGKDSFNSTHTTPDAISLHRLFSEMVVAGCEYCFMEVSSHAVAQQRIGGVRFKGGVFTNLTHDHLDYHLTFDNYLKAKKSFFDNLGSDSFVLTNVDDRNGKIMVQNTMSVIKTYGLKTMCDFKGKILQNSLEGLMLEINGIQLHSRLVGEFNAYNLLAIYGTAVLLGFEKDEVLMQLSNLVSAEGRFEVIRDGITSRHGIVDYAHTPDALYNILTTIKEVKPKSARIISVVGCGGDRDRAKRPVMGRIASENSDVIVFTSDNPRSEDPETILNEMLEGVGQDLKSKVVKITDRRQALKTACMLSKNNDVIVVVGKGHEKYQEIKGVKFEFNDHELLEHEMRESAINI
jgi:UDP-N-acetylmuramoyl-L-alanyl-D-glutamate--2,6-diaminopimelate ligase